MDNLIIDFTKNPDGTVTMPAEKLDELVNSNNEMLADIKLAVDNISTLLKKLDIINKKTGEFQQPSIGRITGALTSSLMGSGNTFDYLVNLKPMLLKYAQLSVNTPQP